MSADLTDKIPKNDSEKLNIILTTVRSLASRVHRLEEWAEEKRYDTRPLWEKLQADIADLKDSLHSGLGEIKSEIGGIRSEIGEIKSSVRDLSRKQSVLNDSMLQVHADLRDMDLRLFALESTHNQNSSP